MKRAYKYFRLTGYICGMLGGLLVLLGRKGILPRPFFVTGGVLVLIMAVVFLVNYVTYVVIRLQR